MQLLGVVVVVLLRDVVLVFISVVVITTIKMTTSMVRLNLQIILRQQESTA